MKVETKEDALIHCFDLWLWLSLHPNEQKSDWPGWYWNGGYLSECNHNCPVCEYDLVVNNNGCEPDCLISWTSGGGGCCSDGSPYKEWSPGRSNAKDLALDICTLALDALFELQGI